MVGSEIINRENVDNFGIYFNFSNIIYSDLVVVDVRESLFEMA